MSDQTYVRFYEKNPTVNQAVTSLCKFPEELRTVLAKGMCAIAETEFSAHTRIRDLKSLGTEKVLALYKSEQKRRDYDTDPYLSKAMNYLMILEPPNQFFLATKVNDLIQVVHDFMRLCKQYAQKIQIAIVERITGTYVHGGLNEAEALLNVIHAKFERYFARLRQPSDDIPSTDSVSPDKLLFWESISTEGAGMRLRLEN